MPADFLTRVDVSALYRWFLSAARHGVVRALEWDIGCSDAWTVIYGVLGIVGRQLEHLRVASDAEGCYEAGGRAGESEAGRCTAAEQCKRCIVRQGLLYGGLPRSRRAVACAIAAPVACARQCIVHGRPHGLCRLCAHPARCCPLQPL